MELLLILSAMLSAVTGAFAGPRAPESAMHRAESAVSAAQVPAAVRRQAPSVTTALPAVPAVAAEVHALEPFALVAAVPLYADRLIE